MNVAITRKFARESWLLLAVVVYADVFFVVLFVWAMQAMGPQLMEFMSSVGFLRNILEMAYGISIEGMVSSNTLFAICYLHPVILALSWGFVIASASKFIAGEIDQGTADLLLALPVHRATVMASGAWVWVAGAVVIALCPLLGIWIGTRLFEPSEPIRFGRFAIVSVNFLAINVAIGALTAMVSSFVRRRGHAVAVIVALAIAWMAMNFLQSLLPAVEQLKFLSLLNYYQPADISRDGLWPVSDLLVLGSVTIVSLLIGLTAYCRRDIPAP